MKYLLKILKVIILTVGIALGCVCIVLAIAFLAQDKINLPFINDEISKIELPEQVAEVIGVKATEVEGLAVDEYERDVMVSELLDKFPWDLKVTGDGIEYALDDAVADKITKTVDEGYLNPTGNKYKITFSDEEISSIADKTIQEIGLLIQAMNTSGELIKYNESTDSFEFEDIVVAPEINEEKLREDIITALNSGEYSKEIQLENIKDAEIISAKQFSKIGTFESIAKKNANRDANILLACQTINGTILQPGEEFSYNEALGERTKAKGYKEAGVYLNGEHTTGVGGGICQLSSTLYNAIFAANMKVTNRTGHTFEPSYVRPGLDATVSYKVPEFSFVNSSEYPIGISCHFVEQVVTVDIYGVSTLEEGVSRYMRSERIGSVAAPAIIYQDNNTLLPGQEIVVRAGYGGSKWATYEVLEKDGEVISDTYIYTTTYKGEAPIVQRNFLFY